MAEEQKRSGGSGGDSPESASAAWTGLLHEAGKRLVPIVVSTGSLLTFIAFAGAVIVWTRLSAVKIAADQAITAYPRSELVAVGSSLLLLFGFFGALAVLGAFLIDRGGRPTLGMARGLLALLMVEGITAILLVTGPTIQETAIAILLFLLPASFAIWIVSFERFSELSDELHSRERETKMPRRRESILRFEEFKDHRSPAKPKKTKKKREKQKEQDEGFWGRVISWMVRTGPRKWLVRVLPILLPAGFTVALGLLIGFERSNSLMIWMASVMTGIFWLLLLLDFAVDARQVSEARKREQREEREKAEGLAEQEEGVVEGLEESSPEEIQKQRRRLALENKRLALKRPFRLVLNGLGMATVFLALLVAAALPAWRLEELWLGAALAAAAVIAMGLWRIAIFTRDRVVWFGLTVFLSVPLFGTLMTMARNLDDPQIQPVALIRSTDGPDEAIQGLYVTEAKERVYFATVATEGCTGKLRPNSGRLLWVPKDELVAMSIGPLQSVESAAKTSLEMAFALTPAIETSTRGSVDLDAGATEADDIGAGEGAAEVHRLENVGVAVRPTFGRGLSVEPEDAQPGEPVTLKMSTPIKDGFGPAPEGRSVRVGGVPAKVMINPTREASRAEYVKAGRRSLRLDKTEHLYVKDEDGMRPFDPSSDGSPEYVRLDPSVGVADPHTEEGDHPGAYLPLADRAEETEGEPGESRDELEPGLKVAFKGESSRTSVGATLLRKAWSRDEIRFYVPDGSESGTITVDCEQLAGQPLIAVEKPPEAQIAVRLAEGGDALILDGSRSSDDGVVKAYRWAHNGNRLTPRAKKRGEGTSGGGTRARVEIAGGGVHRVRLAVEDGAHEVDTASVYVLRIRSTEELAGGARERGRQRVREALAKMARSSEPAAVWVDGHGAAPGRRGRGPHSLRAARSAFNSILTPGAAERAGIPAEGAPVTLRGFAARCGVVPRDSDRHDVDIFIVDTGVRVLRPRACRARTVNHDEVLWVAESQANDR